MSQIKWEWQTNDGSWKSYSKEDVEAIETALANFSSEVKIPSTQNQYKIDLLSRKQIKCDQPEKRRAVRRIPELVSPTSAASDSVSKKKRNASSKSNENDEEEEEEEKEEEEESDKKKKRPSRTAASKKKSYNESEEEEEEEEEETSTTKKLKGYWKMIDSVLIHDPPSCTPSTKIIGFDFDSTLVTTKSGKTFATSSSDWTLFSGNVKSVLNSSLSDGFKLVIFTNQGGIGKGKQTRDSVLDRIQNVLLHLDLLDKVQVFAATKEDHFRKPGTSMWDLMCEKFNGNGNVVDKSQSFYVGDAAGRSAQHTTNRKKDFSSSDRKFAMNIGIQFKTPEEFFHGNKAVPFTLDGFNPAVFKNNNNNNQNISTSSSSTTTTTTTIDYSSPGGKQEIVVFVGFPASGKSTFAKRHFVGPHGYVHINRDTLKTKEKCIKVAQESIDAGKSVVVDNTSPGKEDRVPFVQMAKKKGIPIRCFLFGAAGKKGTNSSSTTTSTAYNAEDLSHHLNKMREVLSNGVQKHVPSVAYNTFKSKYVEPTKDEGFSEVRKIEFVPNFENEKHEKLFFQFF